MERFLTSPKINVNTPNNVLPTRLAIAQKEILARMTRSLQEIKHANFGAKLASKHVILSTIINVGPTSFMRNIAKVLGVHCQNIDIVMQRRNITSDTCDALWSLFVRNRRIDGCTVGAKIVCLYLVGIKDTSESQQR
jgi:hypothetical protein